MTLGTKRQADVEPQPSRPKKRQAAPPTARITRSSRKVNGDAVQLNPGLPMERRHRKKPVVSVPNQRECRIAEAPSQIDSPGEPVCLPAAMYIPATSKPVEQASAESASNVCALRNMPECRGICAPLLTGSDRKARRHPEVITTDAPRAANPGGPAPIAYMGGDIPIASTYPTDDPPDEDDSQAISLKRLRRTLSHSSLISPRSGPVQICSIACPSRPDDSESAGTSSSAVVTKTMILFTEDKVDWSRLDPEWLKGGDEMWRAASMSEPKPVVVEATHSVNLLEQEREPLSEKMNAQDHGDDVESHVVDIPVSRSTEDVVDESMNAPATGVDSEPVIAESGANALPVDSMKCSVSVQEIIKLPVLQPDATMSDLSTSVEYTNAPCPPESVDLFHHSDEPPPSGKGPEIDCIVERDTPRPSTATIPFKSISASPTADVSCPPKSPSKTAQQIANLHQEKQLKEKLIRLRKARLTAAHSCVQNVLVRSPDGSMSIITTQGTHGANYDMEEDRYSVEEYEEDSVCY
ncbi:hypothetical protein N0V93_007678 [Gnomoniopsis smithogilvyi]|uniref:Uncharacterized protein n=1 Tax=Gnomoniopsis smithogilvyi TaxID=1191159 RepID=A0A9W9CT64_9PEZI|nr:hypothetical protein N0V93_007678 [Gnomoniopsis smithogilvyi]